MIEQFLLGFTGTLVAGLLVMKFLKEKFMEKSVNGNEAFDRIRTLYLQLEALRKEKAEYDRDQNNRIKITQEALVKIIHADPNQTEIELESEDK